MNDRHGVFRRIAATFLLLFAAAAVAADDSRDDAMDGGGRATHGAVAGGGGRAASGTAVEDPAAALAARHQALRAQLDRNAFGVPLVVESVEEDGLKRGEAYGVLAQPFTSLSQALTEPGAWCEIALLHLNIKTCTHERRGDGTWLTFYSGRKFYEPPEKAYALRYAFRVEAARPDYLAVTLVAGSGPLGTRDYRIQVEAIPLGPQAFVHFRYAYRTSLTSSLATSGYLATLGSGKIGFTVVGRSKDGKPDDSRDGGGTTPGKAEVGQRKEQLPRTAPGAAVEYVGGIRGIVERNAVRYYLAIQAYLESPAPEQYAQRLGRWFDLTERYAAQLHELDRGEYLEYKARERAQQLARQQALDAAAR